MGGCGGGAAAASCRTLSGSPLDRSFTLVAGGIAVIERNGFVCVELLNCNGGNLQLDGQYYVLRLRTGLGRILLRSEQLSRLGNAFNMSLVLVHLWRCSGRRI